MLTPPQHHSWHKLLHFWPVGLCYIKTTLVSILKPLRSLSYDQFINTINKPTQMLYFNLCIYVTTKNEGLITTYQQMPLAMEGCCTLCRQTIVKQPFSWRDSFGNVFANKCNWVKRIFVLQLSLGRRRPHYIISSLLSVRNCLPTAHSAAPTQWRL